MTVDKRTGVVMEWTADAACKDMDTALFFGEGTKRRHRPGRPPRKGPRRTATPPELVAVCARCPVRSECLAHALEHFERGWWGGTDEDDRWAMRPEGAHRQRIEAGMSTYEPWAPSERSQRVRDNRRNSE